MVFTNIKQPRAFEHVAVLYSFTQPFYIDGQVGIGIHIGVAGAVQAASV